MKKIVQFSIFLTAIGLAHVSVMACMCPGVNPEMYPPDIDASRTYYRKEFKGSAFTGKVVSSKEASGIFQSGESIQEVTVEVDRYWFGVKRRIITIYTPLDRSGCWTPFVENESYFFIPTNEKNILYLGVCTYSTFNRKADGNYVDFMEDMFGKGKRFKPKKKS
ncbi:MAG: hypothetical protein WBD22_07175 [Pyrinomonadaceae bacterium]